MIFLGSFLPAITQAQAPQGTGGTDFRLLFLPQTGNNTNSLNITALDTARVTVEIIGGTHKSNITVIPGTTSLQVLPRNQCEPGGVEKAVRRVVKVTSDRPITVVASNAAYATSDATLVYPKETFGWDYYVTTYGEGSGTSNFVIVSTENNTRISITPSVKTSENRPAGTPFIITLNENDTYYVSAAFGGVDLTGTRIQVINSNPWTKPIGVFAGNYCTYIGGCSACDHLFEQVLPTDKWGKSYISTPLKTRLGDILRLVAMEDNTVVQFDGRTKTLMAGKPYDTLVYDATYVSSSRPFAALQLSRGAMCDLIAAADADPFMLVLPPLEQMRPLTAKPVEYTFDANSATPNVTKYYMNLLCKTAHKKFIWLDGKQVDPVQLPSDGFAPVPNHPEWSYARIQLNPGSHHLKADSGALAYLYGYGYYESYGYLAGSLLGSLRPQIVHDAPQCPEKPIQFQGFIQGVSPTGWLWRFGDGSTSTVKDPVHAYATEGNYTVTLVVSYMGGKDSVSTQVPVKITYPKAEFSYTKDSFTVHFTGTTNLGVNKWEWDFGDRSTPSSLQNPSHTYVQTDQFLVRLVVWNDCASDTLYFPITVDGKSGGGNATFIGQGSHALVHGFKVHPIPAGRSITLELEPGMDVEQVVWLDATGRKLQKVRLPEPIKGHHYILEVPEYAMGQRMVWMQVTLKSGEKLSKVIPLQN